MIVNYCIAGNFGWVKFWLSGLENVFFRGVIFVLGLSVTK